MPQIAGAPKSLNAILESVYQSCMKADGNPEKCSKSAYGAARRAGWHKTAAGTWAKTSEDGRVVEHYDESVFNFGLDGKVRVRVYNEHTGRFELCDLDKVDWVIKGGRKVPIYKEVK